LLLWALRRWFGSLGSFLEVGCGTGYVLRGVAEAHPSAEVWGSDLFAEGLDFARQRVGSAGFVQADARSLPFRDAFDVVGAFDVIEHIEDDASAVAGLAAAVRPGGGVVITVPQHPRLWSSFDEASHHVRRYRRRELEARLREAGLDLVHLTSFVTLLLPAMALARLRPRAQESGVADQVRQGPRAERVLGAITSAELLLLKRGLRLPAGGSLLAVARRPVA
jgi:SAM-dependent methyltransferase